ncbi:MAG: bacterioferritin-associated ferredoxin [Lysobacteraceae bacterium]|nr:MAG: bacterioferritin-associated ferredoxin [Xanthomonadaceae bacterium]
MRVVVINFARFAMYVCICHAVTDRTIRQAAAEGVETLGELRFRTGCSSSCGQCAEMATEILAERRPLGLDVLGSDVAVA